MTSNDSSIIKIVVADQVIYGVVVLLLCVYWLLVKVHTATYAALVKSTKAIHLFVIGSICRL